MTRILAAISLVLFVGYVYSVWGKPFTLDEYNIFLVPAMLAFFSALSWFMDKLSDFRKGRLVPSKIAEYLKETENEQWKATKSRRNAPDGLGG